MSEPREYTIKLPGRRISVGDGFRFTAGAGLYIGLMIWLSVLTALVFPHHDNTDAGGQHSGLRPYTDHLTGCEYLSTGSGLTPRLNRVGLPMCAQ